VPGHVEQASRNVASLPGLPARRTSGLDPPLVRPPRNDPARSFARGDARGRGGIPARVE